MREKTNIIISRKHKFFPLLLSGLICLILIANSFPLNSYKRKIDNKKIQNADIYPFYSYAYEWHVTWGGDDFDFCYDVAIDNSSNIYMTGRAQSFGFSSDQISVIKFDLLGNKIWNFTYGNGVGKALAIDSSGNLIIVGSNLIKIANNGSLFWKKNFGVQFKAISLDSYNNIYLASSIETEITNSSDIFLMKCDPSGIQLWNKTWGGIKNESSYEIVLDSNNNIYLAGVTSSYGAGDMDACLVKFNNSGELLWYITFGGPDRDRGTTLTFDTEDNVYLAGAFSIDTLGEMGGVDMFVVKYNPEGVRQWYKFWGAPYADAGCQDLLINKTTNDLFLCGYSYYGNDQRDFCILSLRGDATFSMWAYIEWGGYSFEYPYASVFDSQGNIYFAGATRSFGSGLEDWCLVRFGKDSDRDGLSDNQEENLYNTSPHDFDTDHDDLTDWEEIKIYYTNPIDKDTDHDDLTDWEEIKIYHTNPCNSDTDGDGFSDSMEINWGVDPNNFFSNPTSLVLVIITPIIVSIVLISLIIYKKLKKRRIKISNS